MNLRVRCSLPFSLRVSVSIEDDAQYVMLALDMLLLKRMRGSSALLLPSFHRALGHLAGLCAIGPSCNSKHCAASAGTWRAEVLVEIFYQSFMNNSSDSPTIIPGESRHLPSHSHQLEYCGLWKHLTTLHHDPFSFFPRLSSTNHDLSLQHQTMSNDFVHRSTDPLH